MSPSGPPAARSRTGRAAASSISTATASIRSATATPRSWPRSRLSSTPCPSARGATPIGRRSTWRGAWSSWRRARLGKVLLAPSGSAAIGMALKLARHATGRHKTVSMWDAFHGANLDAISVGGEALFRKDVGPLLPGAEHVPPLGLASRFFGDRRPRPRAAGRLHRLCPRGPGRRRRGDRRADALDHGRAAAARLLAQGAGELRPPRRPADLRRDPELSGPHGHHVRRASRPAACRTCWCSARAWAAASCRWPP